MDIKISVDNNFFNAYYAGNEDAKNEFLVVCQNKKISFYLTLDLIAELFALYGVNRPLLSKYSKLLLKLGDFRIFRQWQDIVLQELGIVTSNSRYCNDSEVENIVKILRHLSLGQPVENEAALNELIETVKKHKEQWFHRNKEEKSLLVESLKKLNAGNIKFGQFYNSNGAIDIRKEAINTILASLNINFSDKKALEIATNQDKYPYFHMASKIDTAYFYFHNIKNRAVGYGDSWDSSYFVYLVDLDYLTSEEKRLKNIAKIIFGDSNRVINFEETSDLVNKLKSGVCS